MIEEALGTDLDWVGDLVVTPTGDIGLVAGRRCLAKDLVRRMETMRGALWRNPEFGLPWRDWLQAEWDDVMTRGLQAAVVRAAEADPRVARAEASVIRTGQAAVRVELRAVPNTGDELNLVLGFGLDAVTVEVLGG